MFSMQYFLSKDIKPFYFLHHEENNVTHLAAQRKDELIQQYIKKEG